MQTQNKIIKWLDTSVSREQRESLNEHCGSVLWFIGLLDSGESTMSNAVGQRLHKSGYRTFLFDGDNICHALCKDRGFSREDLTEYICRIGEVAKLFDDAGVTESSDLDTAKHNLETCVERLLAMDNLSHLPYRNIGAKAGR